MYRFIVFLGLVAAAVANAWTQGIPTFLGHEELTVIAIALTGDSYYPAGNYNQLASESDNPLVLGNFAMDYPTGGNNGIQRFVESREPVLRAYVDTFPLDADGGTTTRDHMWNAVKYIVDPDWLRGSLTGDLPIVGGGDWQHDPAYQPLHFLVNPEIGAAASEAQAKSVIRSISHHYHGVLDEQLAAGPSPVMEIAKERDLFALGAALHIIQDSFSPAHTKRSGVSFLTVDSLCVYGPPTVLPELCHHLETDPRDIIWADPANRMSYPMNSYEALRPEAKAAVEASVAFLNAHSEIRAFMTQRLAQLKTKIGELSDAYMHSDGAITLQQYEDSMVAETTAAQTAIDADIDQRIDLFFAVYFGAPGII